MGLCQLENSPNIQISSSHIIYAKTINIKKTFDPKQYRINKYLYLGYKKNLYKSIRKKGLDKLTGKIDKILEQTLHDKRAYI